jgi:hypothetical protein
VPTYFQEASVGFQDEIASWYRFLLACFSRLLFAPGLGRGG